MVPLLPLPLAPFAPFPCEFAVRFSIHASRNAINPPSAAGCQAAPQNFPCIMAPASPTGNSGVRKQATPKSSRSSPARGAQNSASYCRSRFSPHPPRRTGVPGAPSGGWKNKAEEELLGSRWPDASRRRLGASRVRSPAFRNGAVAHVPSPRSVKNASIHVNAKGEALSIVGNTDPQICGEVSRSGSCPVSAAGSLDILTHRRMRPCQSKHKAARYGIVARAESNARRTVTSPTALPEGKVGPC